MKRSRAFRPDSLGPLEGRVVLSGIAAISHSVSVSHLLLLEKQVLRDVQWNFNIFRRTYAKDAKTILFAPSHGKINPAANRAAFDSAVKGALTTLSSSLVASISTVPNPSPLATSIQGFVIGAGSSSLQTRLAAIPTPSMTGTNPAANFRVQAYVAVATGQTLVSADALSYMSGHGVISG